MDDAYIRLKYMKKLNPRNNGNDYDDDLIDEVGIQDWGHFNTK